MTSFISPLLIPLSLSLSLSLSLRTGVLCCTSDKDFLAKLHCVREAVNVLLLSPTNRDYLITAGRDMVVSLLDKSAKVRGNFCENFYKFFAIGYWSVS